VVNQDFATLKPTLATSTLQNKRSRSHQISGRGDFATLKPTLATSTL
jgi:hypothetical protein